MRFKNPPWDLLGKVSLATAQSRKYFQREIVYELEYINEIKDDTVRLLALEDMYDTALSNLRDYTEVFLKYVGDIDSRILGNKPYLPDPEIYLRFKSNLLANMDKFTEITKQVLAAIDQLKAKIKIEDKYILGGDLKIAFSSLFLYPETERGFFSILRQNDYITEDDEWITGNRNKGQLREAYYALKEMRLLKRVKNNADAIRTFYKRFGLQPEEEGVTDHYISTKSINSNVRTKDYVHFLEILKPLELTRVRKGSLSSGRK